MGLNHKLRYFLFFGAIAVFLPMLGGLSARVYLGTDHARMFIQDQINRAIPGSISWKDHQLSLFAGRVDLRGVQVADANGETLVSLDRLYLDIAYRELLEGSLTAELILLDKPRVLLVTDSEGGLNLVQAFYASDPAAGQEQEGAPFPLNIRIEKLRLQDGFLQYRDSGNDSESVALRNIAIDLEDGDLGQQTVRATVRLSEGRVQWHQTEAGIQEFQAAARLKKGGLDPLSVDLKSTHGLALSASGHVADLFGEFRPFLDIRAAGNLSEIDQILALEQKLEGDFAARLDFREAVNDPVVRVEIDMPTGKVEGMPIENLHIAGEMSERNVWVERADGKTPYGRLNLEGRIDLRQAFPGGFLASDVEPDHISYQLVLKMVESEIAAAVTNAEGVQGTFDAVAHLDGKGVSWPAVEAAADVRVMGKSLGAADYLRPFDGDAKARILLKNSRVVFEELEVQTGKSHVTGSGQVNADTGEITGHVWIDWQEAQSEMVVDLPETIRGRVRADVAFGGVVGNPAVHARIQGEELGYGAVSIGNADMDLRLKDGVLFADQLQLKNGQSALTASGQVHVFDAASGKWSDCPTFAMRLSEGRLRIEDFVEHFKGDLSVRGELGGDFDQPAGNADISGSGIDLGFQAISAFDFPLRMEKGTLFVKDGRAEVTPGEEIAVEGWVSEGREYHLDLSTSGIRLSSIRAIEEQDWGSARLAFHLSGKGHLSNPAVNGEMGIHDMVLNGDPLEPVVFQVDLRDWIVRASRSGEMTVDAAVDLNTFDIRADAACEAADVTSLLYLIGIENVRMNLDGRVSIDGNLRDVQRMKATAEVGQLEAFFEKEELLRTSGIQLQMADGVLTLPAARFSLLKGGSLEVKGRADWKGEIDVQMSGRVPFQAAAVFLPEVSGAEGAITCKAAVSGNFEDPELQAEIGLKQVGLKMPYVYQKLRDLNGIIRISTEDIFLEHIRGNFEGGDFAVEGAVTLAERRPVNMNVTLKAHAVPVQVPDVMETLVDLDLVLGGSWEASTLEGELVILEGSYFRNVELDLLETVSSRSREESVAEASAEEPFLSNLQVNITVGARNPFVVNNNVALLVLRPSLRIRGTGSRLLLDGRAEVEEGVVVFRKKEFEVTRGVIDFINPYRVEPTIDVQGKTSVREWTIYLAISGTPEDLKLSMRSEPAEKDGDILSLLLFGKTVRELTKGEGESGSSAQMVADLVAQYVAKDIKESTGLDSFSLEYTSDGSENGSGGVRVSMGKDLSRRVSVHYNAETRNGKLVQRARTEYKFLENLIMNAYQDTEGDYGGELQYRMEFR